MVEDGLGGARDWSAAYQGWVAESVRAGIEMSSSEIEVFETLLLSDSSMQQAVV